MKGTHESFALPESKHRGDWGHHRGSHSGDQELVQERTIALVLLCSEDQVLVLFSQQHDNRQAQYKKVLTPSSGAVKATPKGGVPPHHVHSHGHEGTDCDDGGGLCSIKIEQLGDAWPSCSMTTMRELASITPAAAAAAPATARVEARRQTMRRGPIDVVIVVMQIGGGQIRQCPSALQRTN